MVNWRVSVFWCSKGQLVCMMKWQATQKECSNWGFGTYLFDYTFTLHVDIIFDIQCTTNRNETCHVFRQWQYVSGRYCEFESSPSLLGLVKRNNTKWMIIKSNQRGIFPSNKINSFKEPCCRLDFVVFLFYLLVGSFCLFVCFKVFFIHLFIIFIVEGSYFSFFRSFWYRLTVCIFVKVSMFIIIYVGTNIHFPTIL